MTDSLTSSSIQTTAASFAFEMLGLLMRNENLEVVKVALTVVAPRSRKDLLDIWVIPLLLSHLEMVLPRRVGGERWIGE